MILTLQDDGVLRVYKSVDDVVADIEALDAEETLRAVFDDSGETYAIHWIRPNEQGRFLRFIVAKAAATRRNSRPPPVSEGPRENANRYTCQRLGCDSRYPCRRL